MAAPRTPRTVKAATALLERFAELDGQIAGLEADRTAAIAATNASVDALAEPLLAERDQIRDKLAPWWKEAAAELTQGKRKSIELGGCLIGSRSGRDSLAVDGDEKAIVAALQKQDWAGPLLAVVTKLDRKAVLASLEGVYAKPLAKLGLSRKAGEESFYVERTAQAGTLAGARA
jgi:phage host-nuclease inhibitor protein Gam